MRTFHIDLCHKKCNYIVIMLKITIFAIFCKIIASEFGLKIGFKSQSLEDLNFHINMV